MDLNEVILRFFRDDVEGILILDGEGKVLYEDARSAEIYRRAPYWKSACPPPAKGQHGECWDLPNAAGGKPYMVTTSTFTEGDKMFQVHFFTDSSLYMELFRDISGYSRELKAEKEHDGMTGLFNKGKLMELKGSLFRNQDSIAVFNLDVNNLKYMNDTFGHEAGDQLIRKAAQSLKRIEARNVMPFRVGGDEFMVIALHITRDQAEELFHRWEEALAELNRAEDGITCVVACGMAYGEKGYDPDELFALADQRMYEDKQAKKRAMKQENKQE